MCACVSVNPSQPFYRRRAIPCRSTFCLLCADISTAIAYQCQRALSIPLRGSGDSSLSRFVSLPHPSSTSTCFLSPFISLFDLLLLFSAAACGHTYAYVRVCVRPGRSRRIEKGAAGGRPSAPVLPIRMQAITQLPLTICLPTKSAHAKRLQ